MKIAFNAGILDEKPTGVGIYTLNILQALAKMDLEDLEIDVYTSTLKGFPESHPFRIKDVSPMVQPARYKKLAGIYRFLWNQLSISRKSKKYDLTYVPTPHGSLLAKNQIITIHDLLGLRYPDQHRFQNYYYRIALPGLIKKAVKVVAISEATKKDVMKFYHCPPEKIEVIHNGIDLSLFSPVDAAGEKIFEKYGFQNAILSVGAGYPHKNIERLIQAYTALPKKLKAKHPLVVTGAKGSYGEKLKELAKSYPDESIFFPSFIDFSDMPALYGASSLLVYPSLYEGFGFPPLEAMACGTAVLVSNSSALPEVSGDAAEYLDPESEEDIKKRMQDLLENPARRDELKKKGFERVREFSWENTASRLLKVMGECSQNRGVCNE